MEEIFIPLIVFAFVLILVKMSFDHSREKARLKYGSTEGNQSLSRSELRELIREAASEANAPLMARLDEIEAALGVLERRALPSEQEQKQLREPLGAEEDAPAARHSRIA